MCQCDMYTFVYMCVLIQYNIKLYSHTCKHANALMHIHMHTRTRVYTDVDYMLTI